jgi:hypothetical protein
MIISIPNYIYTAQFSTLYSALGSYVMAITAIAQTLITEVAGITMQAGYDRAEWFYSVWAECHYSDLPDGERLYDDYALVVAQSTALSTIPTEPDYIDAECWVLPTLPMFAPIALLCAAVSFYSTFTIKVLKGYCKGNGIKAAKGWRKVDYVTALDLYYTTH